MFFHCAKVLITFYCRDLNEDPRTIRKRVEKDRATDKDWVTFKQNPARFTQVGCRQLPESFCNFPYSVFVLPVYAQMMCVQIRKSGIKRIIV